MHYQLKNLEIEISVGVYETEKKALQKLLVSVEFDFEATAAAASDDLNDTIDYSAVEQLARSVCTQKHYELLEHLQAVLLSEISKNFSQLKNVTVCLEKFPFENGSVVVS